MQPIDWKRAEEIAGRRLDRRRSYATTEDESPTLDGFVLFVGASWTDSCSGCGDGSGCRECGYTGKRRWSVWVPVTNAAAAA